MPQSPAATFALIVTLTNRLASELPRNSQIAELRFLLSEYGKQQPRLSCRANECGIGPRRSGVNALDVVS